MNSIDDLFGKSGPFALAIKGYAPRQPQIDMAKSVALAIAKDEQAIVEAGTGTGKTFAYLVPALLSDKKVMVSTGSKALQEQLFHRDLPALKKILGKGKKIALLKGRSNYLCIERLNQHVAHVPVDDPDVMHQLAMVAKFSGETRSGDMADCSGIEEDAKVLPYVTSTTDNCLGKECPSFQDCFVRKARVKAIESDLVVVNHHLFLADAVVKESGFGELIPNVNCYIFDEAHQLPNIASDYFASRVSTRMVIELVRDIRLVYRGELFDMIQLGKTLDKLETAVFDLRLQFPSDSQRGDWQQMIKQANVYRAIERVINDISFLYQVLKLCLERSDKIEKLFERTASLKGQLETMYDAQKPGFSFWFETTKRHLTFSITPLNVSERFRALVDNATSSWVFTSATLAVNGDLTHFAKDLGLSTKIMEVYDSPFDYENQALLCIPRYLPEPSKSEMGFSIVSIAKQMIKAAKGRCFILFTSYRMLNLVADGLSHSVEYPLLVQGQASKRILLEKFVMHGNSVLLGTASFWEGVDVRGDALSCVIIDKLPFAAPDDPLLQAKMKSHSGQGNDPFYSLQLPGAVIALKQGVGRLIRDRKDKGVLVICDNRLVTREYGRIFLASLPNMARTRDLAKASAFLEKIK
ncbi:putative ATP-dependent helicase DinG [Pseudoalteromonas sp. P1-9]|uniref:ATP-dependent DNA helicase n=1 Tax=Pseudoalteromonas sp. P1-9 TaxID=1710354 RepID=UPI0006D5D5CB|nr:ATP-dependent DNA helicase [Pseudoalteromonas sp. P1-9]KPV95693.1 putative ATP-dependent helicase DinG [Pseudoalteromonas sp. P1-9]